MYAREFGWSPDQVDAIPLRLDAWLMPINDAIENEIHSRRVRAMDAKAKR